MKKYLGLTLIVVGVLMLVGLKLVRLTFVNLLLRVPLLLVIAGVVLHVWQLKRESRY